MSRRHANKRAARAVRLWRRDLIHAAGCTHQDCVVRMSLRDPMLGMSPEASDHPLRPVRVPRSLRWIYGARMMPSRGAEEGERG